jgi:hypothetical protein
LWKFYWAQSYCDLLVLFRVLCTLPFAKYILYFFSFPKLFQTALMQACQYGHWEVVQTLILYKANVSLLFINCFCYNDIHLTLWNAFQISMKHMVLTLKPMQAKSVILFFRLKLGVACYKLLGVLCTRSFVGYSFQITLNWLIY